MKLNVLQYKKNGNDVKNTLIECQELIKNCVYFSLYDGDLYSIIFLFDKQGIIIDHATIEQINANLDRAKMFYDNYITSIELAAKENKFIKNIDIELFKCLNMPFEHLFLSKSVSIENQKIAETIKQQQKKEQNEIKEQNEKIRLESVFITFKDGVYINSSDFISLCELKGIILHPRTKGQLNQYSKTKISNNDLTVPRAAKNKSFSGVFAAAKKLMES